MSAKATNFTAPYTAAAASAIVAIGVQVDRFGAGQQAAYVQSALIRLGFELGDLDGVAGARTNAALTQAGFPGNDLAAAATFLDGKLKQQFADEF